MVGTPSDDAFAERYHGRSDKQLKRGKGLIFATDKVDCGPFGELVGDLADKLVSTMSRRFEGAHEISVHDLKGRINGGVVSFLGVSQLMAFPHRTYVTVRNRTVECDSIAILSVHELEATLIEVSQPPAPHLGIGHRIHCQLLPAYRSALRSNLKE